VGCAGGEVEEGCAVRGGMYTLIERGGFGGGEVGENAGVLSGEYCTR
jgi:hypothetical protein